MKRRGKLGFKLKMLGIYHPLLKRFLMITIIIVIIISIIFLAADAALENAVNELAVIKAHAFATEVIEAAAQRELVKNGIDYSDIAGISVNSSGAVTAVSNNIVKMNLLKAGITRAANSALNKAEKTVFSIPLSSAAGLSFVAGRGPKMNVEVSFFGNIESDFENEFKSVGINQTEHSVILKLKAELLLIVNGKTKQTSVSTGICVAQNVIVGSVPEIKE